MIISYFRDLCIGLVFYAFLKKNFTSTTVASIWWEETQS